MEKMNFYGKVVVVTGAGGGIGAATSESFVQLGAVVFGIDINSIRLNEVSEKINNAHNGSFFPLNYDLTDAQQVNKLSDIIHSRFSGVDVLCNVAGMISRKNILDIDVDEWNKVFDVNIHSMFLLTKSLLPNMIKRGGGAIVNVSSGWGIVGGKRAIAYCTTKGAVNLFTKALAVDFGSNNIRVNCVCPGDTATNLLKDEAALLNVSYADLLDSGKLRPLGRVGDSFEIASAIVFLASDAASFIAGASLVVDGGSLAGTL